MSVTVNDQLQLQLRRANERLFSILTVDLSICDARAMRAHAEDLEACIDLIDYFKRLLTYDLALAPQLPPTTSIIPSGEECTFDLPKVVFCARCIRHVNVLYRFISILCQQLEAESIVCSQPPP